MYNHSFKGHYTVIKYVPSCI